MTKNFISLEEVVKMLYDPEDSLKALCVPEGCNNDNKFIADPQDAQKIVEVNKKLKKKNWKRNIQLS